MRATATLLLLLSALASVTGCAGGAVLRPEATLPRAARTEPQGYLVVTVRNPLLPLPTRAASSPRGYDSAGAYAAGFTARRTAQAIATDYHLVVASSWPIATLQVHCIVYALPLDSDPAVVQAALEHDRRVESVQPLQSFDTAALPFNDPYAALQPNLQRLGIPAAHALSTGAGVRVAVIDTGVDTTHPDLRAHSAIARNFVDTDEVQFRGDAHGTAVAGVIAAIPNNRIGIAGIAPDVQLLSFKACWRLGVSEVQAVCNTFTLAQALAAAIEAHADVINLSLAGPSDPLLTRLVQRALAAGAIVVGAVTPSSSGHEFPAEISGVIGVDAIEDAAATTATLRAPGQDVLSLAPYGHYDFYSGSSLASAEVSGIVALLRAQRPRLSSAQAHAVLAASTAVPVGADSQAAPDACVALRTLLQRGDCAGAP